MVKTTRTKQKIRVSKNKKKSWSKYCDVKEVEEFLEEKRFEERIGGAVSEKANEELFFVQTNTEEQALKKIKKPLKCYQNIGSYSKVQPPVNPNINSYPKKLKTALSRVEEKKCKRILACKPLAEKEDKKNSQNGLLYSRDFKDLWNDEEKEVDSEVDELIKYRDEITRKRTPKVPVHRFQKPSLLPSVEVPHPGASYNPSYDDHQELLHEALKVEEQKKKEELHIEKVLTNMFPTRAEAPTAESFLKEMSQGLFDEPDPKDEKAMHSDFVPRNPPVSANDRLPRSRKRKRKEMKEQARLRALEKLHKMRQHDIFRLRSIKSKIKEEQEISAKRQEKKNEREVEKMYKPRTLSKHKYEAPDLEINLSEELTGSLRTLKTEGNLLEDRYKSLQRRNLLEPRIRQKRKRKYKLKVQVKRSHRNFK